MRLNIPNPLRKFGAPEIHGTALRVFDGRPTDLPPLEPGQESVWDYPRPPFVELVDKRIEIFFHNHRVASTDRAYRVLETSHPPVFYLPPSDIDFECLSPTDRSTFCEFKGNAAYYTVTVGDRSERNAAWCYPTPSQNFALLSGYVAFYPSKMDRCTVGDETVQAQESDFYGGWITSEIVGPFKGAEGSWDW